MGAITVVVKLGAGEVATKLPAYLETLGRCKPDLLIFSDRKDNYNGFEVIDVLANLRAEDKANNTDFRIYERMQHGNMTDIKSEEGWRLDKYKFLPMMEWTASMRPESQWYVFVELDTYVNYDNLHRFLTNFSPTSAHYFGSPVWPKNKPTFAHGGSGFILSSRALEKMMAYGRKFGEEVTSRRRAGAFLPGRAGEESTSQIQIPGSHFFGEDVEKFCCGDEVLALVLKKSGVALRGYWPMFNGEKPATVTFNKQHWCEAIVTMHHLGDDDMSKLTKWEAARSHRNRPLTFEELFAMIEPYLAEEVADWTNMSEDVTHQKGTPPAETFKACHAACVSDVRCMQFDHSGSECRLGYSIRLGHYELPQGDRKWTSGWMMARIEAFKAARSPCQGAHLVHPNP